MIAARLAGGNLFFAFFVVEDFFGGGFFGALGAARSSSEHSDFFEGDFVVGDFWEHSEHSEQLGALGFFLRGFCWGGFFFFVGGGGVCFGL